MIISFSKYGNMKLQMSKVSKPKIKILSAISAVQNGAMLDQLFFSRSQPGAGKGVS
jgi:hypothetical protein